MLTLGRAGGIAVVLHQRYVYPENIEDVYDGDDRIWPDRYVFVFDNHSGTVFDNGMGGTYTVPIKSTKNGLPHEFTFVESDPEDFFETSKSGNDIVVTIGEGPDPSYVFKYSNTTETDISVTAPQGGTTYTKTIISETAGTEVLVPFDSSSNVNWITVDDSNDDVTITVTANDTTESRTGRVTFTQRNSGLTLTFTVTQPGKEVVVPPPPVEEDTYVFKWTGIESGNYQVSLGAAAVSSAVTITGLVSTKNNVFQNFSISGAPEWFTLTKNDSNTTLTYTATANTGEEARTATITLTQSESNKTVTITVTQDGKEHVPVYVFKWDDTESTEKTYEFNLGPDEVSNSAIIGLTSTKDGQYHEWSISSAPDWVTTSKVGAGDSAGISFGVTQYTE